MNLFGGTLPLFAGAVPVVTPVVPITEVQSCILFTAQRVPLTVNIGVSRITPQLSQIVKGTRVEMMITNSIRYAEVVMHREEACHRDA